MYVFVKAEPLNYGLKNKDSILKELNTRIGAMFSGAKTQKRLQKISRVLYGLQMVKYFKNGVIQMVQMKSTSEYRDYWYVDLSSNARLYVEERENDVAIFMVTTKNIDDFRRMLLLI